MAIRQRKYDNHHLNNTNPIRQNTKLQRIANPSTPIRVARVQISHSPHREIINPSIKRGVFWLFQAIYKVVND